jgi:pantetheine-phosphate adenylyltransferase
VVRSGSGGPASPGIGWAPQPASATRLRKPAGGQAAADKLSLRRRCWLHFARQSARAAAGVTQEVSAVPSRRPITAVYPGTFDPMTLGHEDLMRRAASLFDRLVLAVAAGHHKRTMFTLDERMEVAQEAAAAYGNVEVQAFRGLLSDFVVGASGKVVVRGLRAVTDFEYEFQMAGMNRHLMPEVETVFMTPSDQFQFVSGTFVREIASLGGDVSKFVAPSVLRRLKERVSQTAQP